MDEELAARGRVWVVLLSQPEMTGGPPEVTGLANRFTDELKQRGTPYSRDLFIGMQNVWLFHCGDGSGGPLRGAASPVP